eukprot:jgi/Galph1/2068/GphlegSOOS_G745.1
MEGYTSVNSPFVLKDGMQSPSLKCLFSPTPLKNLSTVETTKGETSTPQHNERVEETNEPTLLVSTLDKELEKAQQGQLPTCRRLLLPSSKRKSSLRATKNNTRDLASFTMEEAIQAATERTRVHNKRVLSLIASRDPVEEISPDEFWKHSKYHLYLTEEHSEEHHGDEFEGLSSPLTMGTDNQTTPTKRLQSVDKLSNNDKQLEPYIEKSVNAMESNYPSTTPCTVQVDFEVQQSNFNDENETVDWEDDTFPYVMHPHEDSDLPIDRQEYSSHPHSFKIQHVGGMTLNCDSASPSPNVVPKRPKNEKSDETVARKRQTSTIRKSESKQGPPRELRFLPAARETDGLHEVGSGLRRSQRTRFPVLKFWKNETILYERRDSRQFPTIAGILAYPDTPQEENCRKSKRRRRVQHHNSRSKHRLAGHSSSTEDSDSADEERIGGSLSDARQGVH